MCQFEMKSWAWQLGDDAEATGVIGASETSCSSVGQPLILQLPLEKFRWSSTSWSHPGITTSVVPLGTASAARSSMSNCSCGATRALTACWVSSRPQTPQTRHPVSDLDTEAPCGVVLLRGSALPRDSEILDPWGICFSCTPLTSGSNRTRHR